MIGAASVVGIAGLCSCGTGEGAAESGEGLAVVGSGADAEKPAPEIGPGDLDAPVMDGEFGDWRAPDVRVVDAEGDAIGGFDVLSVEAIADRTEVFVRLTLASPLNLQSGEDGDGTLEIRAKASNGRTAVFDLRAKTFEVTNPLGVLTAEGWEDLRFVSMPTTASTEFEIRFDLAAAEVDRGQPIEITLAGSDVLDEPILLALNDRPDPARVGAEVALVERGEGVLRIASMNVERDAILSEEHGAALQRLLACADADVVCLQEVYRSEEAAILEAIEPLVSKRAGDGGVHLHRVYDCFVLSRLPMIPVESHDRSYAGAVVVTSGEGEPPTGVLVMSVHPKCCGFAGSEEDERRLEQSRAMLTTMRDLRSGVDEELRPFSGVPYVIVGDWNRVGSDRQTAVFMEAEGLGAPTIAPLRHLEGVDAYTYYNDGGSFPPGLLDLAIYDDSLLDLEAGWILESSTLSEQTRRELGIREDDSRSSDHLLLVVDVVAGGGLE